MKINCLKKLMLCALFAFAMPSYSSDELEQTMSAASPLNSPLESPIKQANVNRAVKSIGPYAKKLMKETGVPGVAIAVVQGDKIIYAQGFGVRRVGTNLKVTPDTIFSLASVSKSLAATVVAGAVDHGKVSWDDPVAKYLTDFTLKNKEVGEKVTIADMFAHRSGLPDHAGDLLEDLGYTQSEIFYRLRFEPLKPFLTTFAYTNFGLTAGAEAVAKAEGLSWAELSERELYTPLNMTSTSSKWVDYQRAENKADIHTKDAKGIWKTRARNADEQSAAGGASSSVNDLAKWMILMLNDGEFKGKQIIDKNELLKLRELPDNVRPLVKRLTSFYALGMNVSTDKTGRLRMSHSGAFALGAGTNYALLPSERLGIVVLTNGMPLGVSEAISQRFLDIAEHGEVHVDNFPKYLDYFTQLLAYRGELVGKQPPAEPAPALPDDAYIGTYANEYYGPAIVKKTDKGMSLVVGPDKRTLPLRHWDGNTFAFDTGGENSIGISSVEFTPAKGDEPASMKVEFFNANGLGIFTKVP
jgi:CubicO group peptidase (beta-lactamase class C family)